MRPVVGQEKPEDELERFTVACCSALILAISVICLMSEESTASAPSRRAMADLRRLSMLVMAACFDRTIRDWACSRLVMLLLRDSATLISWRMDLSRSL